MLADRALTERLAVVVSLRVLSGTCATPGCDDDHPIGKRYCTPCRRRREAERKLRWWHENRSTGRAA